MKKTTLFLNALFLTIAIQAQTFTGTGGAISDNLDTTYFLLNISTLNPPFLNNAYGLEEACINITHIKDNDLDIYLESPGGTRVELTTDNGGTGDNYITICFRQDATTLITNGTAPFNGSYRPEQKLSLLNNGLNGNGIWKLRVYDDDNNTGNNTGSVVNWRLKFSNSPATAIQVDSSYLPIVVINTNNQTIVDEPKITCDMGIIYNGVGVKNYLTNPHNNYKGKIAIEFRGSSSQGFPKKSYGFETRDALGNKNDTVILGMPNEHDWILSASYTDKTHLRNVLSYKLYNDFGRYAARTRFCELVINGKYMGVYVLMEKIKRDANRVNIAKLGTWENAGDSLTGGYIIKIDKTTGNSLVGWTSPFAPAVSSSGQTIKYQYDYPDPDSITPQQKTYIQQYVDSFETALSGPNFADTAIGYVKYCKVNTFIDYFILNEISSNIDGYRISTFLYKDKYSKGGKLAIGPPWDFDIAWLNANYCGSPSYSNWAYKFGNVCPNDGWQIPFWWDRFMTDPNFTSKLKCRWLALRSTVLDTGYINNYLDSMATLLAVPMTRNFSAWPILGTYVWPNPTPYPATYQAEIDRMKSWIRNRLNWMDANLPGTCLTASIASNNLLETTYAVFPNPSKGVFDIAASNNASFDWELYTIYGEKIHSLGDQNVKTQTQVDLSNKPNGVYFLKTNSKGITKAHKIIKAD